VEALQITGLGYDRHCGEKPDPADRLEGTEHFGMGSAVPQSSSVALVGLDPISWPPRNQRRPTTRFSRPSVLSWRWSG
jgi:hypothetical protein